jgi:hypothetical protein
MKQRQSIPFNKPQHEKATLPMASYLIEHSEIPIIFLDLKEFEKSFDGQNTLELVETQKDVDYINAMSDFTVMTMSEPAVAIISPNLCIVGNKSNYYIVDLYNEIFYTSQAPEYEFPNTTVEISFYKQKKTTEEPQVKKLKTTKK